MKILLLHGAIKNVGDFLIFKRAKQILIKYLPNATFIELRRSESIDSVMKTNEIRGIILCGGPGYNKEFYPKIFTLSENLTDLQVPILALGLGYRGDPMYNYLDFEFTQTSLRAINTLLSKDSVFSARDVYSYEILLKSVPEEYHDQIFMSGCPAWYRMDYFGKELDRKDEVQKIVISNPGSIKNLSRFWKLISTIQKRFGRDVISVVFHRGYNWDENSRMITAITNRMFSLFLKLKGIWYYDLSYDVEKMKLYDDADLHIGYRVHGHIYSISSKIPSILIQEDGRGKSLSTSLELMGDIPFDEPNFVESINQSIDSVLDGQGIAESMQKMEANFTEMEKTVSKYIDIIGS